MLRCTRGRIYDAWIGWWGTSGVVFIYSGSILVYYTIPAFHRIYTSEIIIKIYQL
jgi:hypothetical protein